MKTLLSIFAVALLFTTGASAGDDGSWFDMDNCEICAPLAENPELMANLSWEHFDVTNGIISVTKFKPEFANAYQKAHEKMKAVIKKAEAGEQVNMCNMCKGIGEYAMAGAKMETIESDNVIIGLTSSSDPAVAGKIHAWAERTRAEMKKMQEQSFHEGHNN